MDLKTTFPNGQYSDNQQKYMVKEGAYFWAAAEIIDGEWVMTEFGRRLTGTPVVPVALAKPVEPEVPVALAKPVEPEVPVALAKPVKPAVVAKKAAPTPAKPAEPSGLVVGDDFDLSDL